jgi:hypothetical protein
LSAAIGMKMESTMKRGKACALVLLVILSALGCSSGDGLNRAQVRGEVKVDGVPLEKGSIDFFPIEGTQGPSAGGVIENGKYLLARGKGPAVGRNRVEIHGVRKTGRMVPDHMNPGAMREELVEALPADVNAKSTLVREIAPGTNVVDFNDLKGVVLKTKK